MHARTLAVLILALGGCGSNQLPAGAGGPGGGGGGGGGGGTDGSTGAPLNQRVIDLPSFSVGPGQEVFMCYYVPPDTEDRWVQTVTIDMAPGSHHLVVLRIPNGGATATGPAPCDGLFGGHFPSAMMPGSQEPHTEYAFPDGFGMKVPKTDGLYFQSHYLNATTDQTLEAHVVYTMGNVDQSSVKTQVGSLFYGQWGLKVPTGRSTQSMSCAAPQDFNLLYAFGHMHRHALSFDSSVAGKPLYHTDTWDNPKTGAYDMPGFAVATGDTITWSCTYENDTGSTLVFGDSATKNEMCILAGQYYPADNSSTLFLCN
jgi:hypothetical protein